jgi:uncharacterized damage-inducible protein DinB
MTPEGDTNQATRYQFLVDTYETEIIKVLSVWSMFDDGDLPFRPHPTDARARSVHEQMVHQCVSENLWFETMLDISVSGDPLPTQETRLEFIKRYRECAQERLAMLQTKGDDWWAGSTDFFEVRRSRAWVITRRMTHTSHHRGQQTAMLRMLNHDVHSTYGPTADTGGLMQNHAPVIYPYTDVPQLIAGESTTRSKAPVPGPGGRAPTERPSSTAEDEPGRRRTSN